MEYDHPARRATAVRVDDLHEIGRPAEINLIVVERQHPLQQCAINASLALMRAPKFIVTGRTAEDEMHVEVRMQLRLSSEMRGKSQVGAVDRSVNKPDRFVQPRAAVVDELTVEHRDDRRDAHAGRDHRHWPIGRLVEAEAAARD